MVRRSNKILNQEFTIQNIHDVAKQVWAQYKPYKVWLFDAAMGTGKTTSVGSPTFSIINQYETAAGKKIFHLDLYRIHDEEEAVQAGIEDVLYSGEYCMVEWPEKIPGLLPSDALQIHLETINELKRRISITIPE